MLEKMRRLMKESKVTKREVKMAIIEGLIEGHEQRITDKLYEIGLEVEEHDLMFLIDEITD